MSRKQRRYCPILSHWGAEWNNLQLDLSEEAWDQVYEMLAEEKGCTAEAVRTALKEQYHSDIVAMRNRHNRLCFEEITFTMSSEWVNFQIAEIVYIYAGRVTTEWETWYVFEAELWGTFSALTDRGEAYPVESGQRAGVLQYRLGGKTLGEVEIVTDGEIRKAGFSDYLKKVISCRTV